MDTPPGVCASPVGGGHRANLRARRGGAATREKKKKRARKRFRAKTSNQSRQMCRETAIARSRARCSRASYPGKRGAGERRRARRLPLRLAACVVHRLLRGGLLGQRGGGRGARGARDPDAGSGSRRGGEILPRLERVPGSVPLRRGFRRGSARFRRTRAGRRVRRRRRRRRRARRRSVRGRRVPRSLGALGATRVRRRARGGILPARPARALARHAPVRPERRARDPYCAWPTTCSRRCRATKPGRRAVFEAKDAVVVVTEHMQMCRDRFELVGAATRTLTNLCGDARRAEAVARAECGRVTRRVQGICEILGNTLARRGGTGGWRTSAGRPKARGRLSRRRGACARWRPPCGACASWSPGSSGARARCGTRRRRGGAERRFRRRVTKNTRRGSRRTRRGSRGRRRRRRSPSFGPRRARRRRRGFRERRIASRGRRRRPTPRSPGGARSRRTAGAVSVGTTLDFSLKKTRARSLTRRRAKTTAATRTAFRRGSPRGPIGTRSFSRKKKTRRDGRVRGSGFKEPGSRRRRSCPRGT